MALSGQRLWPERGYGATARRTRTGSADGRARSYREL